MGLIPALVGHGLKNFCHSHYTPTYIVLSTGDNSGELRHEKDLLLHCIEINHDNRRFDERTKEVVLEEFNITLNIEDAYLNYESIRIDPRRLFSPHYISSTALFWGDYNLRMIESNAVVGIGGRATNLESVASYCAIELTHPKMIVIRGERWNQIFQNPYLSLKVRLFGTARFIEGWVSMG